MSAEVSVRRFDPADAAAVRDLFIRVNRALAPAGMAEAFEAYIQRSLLEEIDQIGPYFTARNGAFFVAAGDSGIIGMFGLERPEPEVVELRRMYVDPAARGIGTGRTLLARAEIEARGLGARRIILSTSELQQAALGLYRSAGYTLMKEEVAKQASNKQLGGGLRRYHFEKVL